jgi:hypothetical protein
MNSAVEPSALFSAQMAHAEPSPLWKLWALAAGAPLLSRVPRRGPRRAPLSQDYSKVADDLGRVLGDLGRAVKRVGREDSRG